MNDNIQFETQDINSIEDLLTFSKKHQKDKWIYRGQKEAKWGLTTSLDRAFQNYKLKTAKEKKNAEMNLIREFKRRYNQYSKYVPDISNDIEWLSLMQHYGAPTRLLDFTYSIFIGAYFALEEVHPNENKNCKHKSEDEDYFALWAINSKWAKKETINNLKKKKVKETYVKLFKKFLTNDPLLLQKNSLKQKGIHPFNIFQKIVFYDSIIPFVCPVNTIILNERLTSQKGLFMCPGKVDKNFENNLIQLKNHDDNKYVIKIRIPKGIRLEIMKYLFEMNISRTTLFPGLEGFAKTLGIYHPMAKIDIERLFPEFNKIKLYKKNY